MSVGLANQAVHSALEHQLQRRDSSGNAEPFFITDVSHVRKQFRQWQQCLPRAIPHYAVKCNSDPRILEQLAQSGSGFDCASKTELLDVLNLNVSPARIIFAHPCKSRDAIRFAKSHGVSQMTFDNADELYKIKQEYPEAELFIRILADDPGASCRLGLKYGATVDEALELLDVASQLGLNVCGLSFHVGSGAKSAVSYQQALRDARTVVDKAESIGYGMKTIDLGGGFTSSSFRSFAPYINEALSAFFGDRKYRIIAEPGRYFVEGASVAACNVSARRLLKGQDRPAAMLYLNDGCYGSFGNVVWENATAVPHILRNKSGMFPELKGLTEEATWRYTVWGPTCDSADCINKDCAVRGEINVDDWVYFDNMGAYTTATVTKFNGFSDFRETTYIDSESDSMQWGPASAKFGQVFGASL